MAVYHPPEKLNNTNRAVEGLQMVVFLAHLHQVSVQEIPRRLLFSSGFPLSSSGTTYDFAKVDFLVAV